MTKKILVVNDVPHILLLLAARLKANHYAVIAASNAEQALRAAHEEMPDLLLLDIRMPGEGGMSLFESLALSKPTAAIPVIFLTAYPQENMRDKVLAMGTADFIAKPFNAADQLKKVKPVLAKKSLNVSPHE
ncbi:MAG: response regulator [Kiritimatiellia bacterium]